MTSLVASKEVQALLDRASGIGEAGGNARLKAIMRDFLESTMSLIEKHDITESEFWQAMFLRVIAASRPDPRRPVEAESRWQQSGPTATELLG